VVQSRDVWRLRGALEGSVMMVKSPEPGRDLSDWLKAKRGPGVLFGP